MIQVSPQSKSQHIADALGRAIDAGDYSPGIRLPTIRKLTTHYNTSTSTIENALLALEREGKVIRKARSGVIVNPLLANKDKDKNHILLCLKTDGHIFEPIFTRILSLLHDAGDMVLTLSHRHVVCEEVQPQLLRQVRRALAEEAGGALVYGRDYWKNPFLRRFPPAATVFLVELDYPEIEGHGVLLDYDAAMYALTRHLLATGRRRIAFASSEGALRGDRRLLHFEQLKNGYERALREAGLAASRRYVAGLDAYGPDGDGLAPSATEALARLLRGPDAPDALMGYLDRQALLLRDAAERLGVRVPDDLAVTGFFDTPWARHEGRTLTTVGFDYDYLARRAVALVRARNKELCVEYLPPRLAAGSSTAG